jgi:hypothetical protein
LWLSEEQAVKGAAASFGIITEFVFMTRPEPPNAVVYSYKLQCVPGSPSLSFFCGVARETLTCGHCRLEKHAALAPTFAAWQNIVADPNLDRKLASEVIVFELGMIISGL